MDADRLEYFRKRLLEEQRRLEEELTESSRFNLKESLKDSVKELSAYDNHPADLGSETFEREKDLSLKLNLDEIHQRIGEALGRMDTGQYGNCEDCGREIPLERLEALPYTTLCIECQQEEEAHHQNRKRPIEEEVLTPPFGRTFLDGTNNIVTDGEDIWQSVARYGTSETPSDLGGECDYEDMFMDADEPQGFVEEIDEIADVGPDDIPPNPDVAR
jgi:YteA family regulatory protein